MLVVLWGTFGYIGGTFGYVGGNLSISVILWWYFRECWEYFGVCLEYSGVCREYFGVCPLGPVFRVSENGVSWGVLGIVRATLGMLGVLLDMQRVFWVLSGVHWSMRVPWGMLGVFWDMSRILWIMSESTLVVL